MVTLLKSQIEELNADAESLQEMSARKKDRAAELQKLCTKLEIQDENANPGSRWAQIKRARQQQQKTEA
jgi:hypothetical protein